MIHLVSPECLADFVRFGPLHEALAGIARLADAELMLAQPGKAGPRTDRAEHWIRSYIDQAGSSDGLVAYPADGNNDRLALSGGTIRGVLQHAVGREAAISDFANQLCVCYEELNLIYTLLQAMATKVSEQEIGTALVAQAAETLNCRRVSLLVLDEKQEFLRVLASAGLPGIARDTVIPMQSSVAGKVISEGQAFLIEDICSRPDLAELSRGSYETTVFAAIRVPLQAQGQPIGVLMATERNDCGDFSSRDCKLLEGLSAMGAASLMHCRLQLAIQEQMMSTIRALAHAVDAKDHYTHSHSDRVSRFCVAAAGYLGITDPDALRRIELAGLLHDIGKIAVPDALLSKSTKLTSEEFEKVGKTHVRIGADIIGQVKGLDDVADAVLHHHERYDGRGYPGGLRGDEIPLTSRVVAVADTFDAMTSDRPYRKALSVEVALDELKKCEGAQFDPDVVAAFLTAREELASAFVSETAATADAALAVTET
ncbi:MAG TPA: HD domain-containing phosphohydrolase [Phycisphaerae bacterium]|nr:HD domain-containing phosphohydrolase [Phycisphaerae bacterium]